MRAAALAFAALILAAGPAHGAALQTSAPVGLIDAYAGAAGGDAGLSYRPGKGLVRWDLGAPGANGVRLTTADLEANPLSTLLRPLPPEGGSREAVAVTFVRNWPGAISVQHKRLSLDITPHAGLGFTSAGGRLTEVGAMLRLGSRVMDVVGAADALDGSRLFLFAGVNRRATAESLLHYKPVGRRDEAAVLRQAEAGLGFRRGDLSASLGYTRERTSLKSWGANTYGVDRVGLTISLRPGR